MSATDIMKGCVRGFHHTTAAFYFIPDITLKDDETDLIMIGVYHEQGGTRGEFSVVWKKLGGKITPRLHAYDDSWAALWLFKDVLEAMAAVDGEDITPASFIDLLTGCGVVDLTQREDRATMIRNEKAERHAAALQAETALRQLPIP